MDYPKGDHAAERIITLSEYEKSLMVEHLNIAPERICATLMAANPVDLPASKQDKISSCSR